VVHLDSNGAAWPQCRTLIKAVYGSAELGQCFNSADCLLLMRRTQNPWEANMFYIPAMTFAFSINTGNTVLHSRRAIDYVRQQWPFFNR